MLYHYRNPAPEFEALESLNALAVEAFGLIQWHQNDYTLVAQASYVILGRYVKDSRRLINDSPISNLSLSEAREIVLSGAKHDVVGESDQDDIVTFYEMWDAVQVARLRSFPDDAADLVESFVDCMVSLTTKVGSDEHKDQALRFRSALEVFLGAYKGLSEDDVIRYISKIGVSKEQARRDFDIVMELYLEDDETPNA